MPRSIFRGTAGVVLAIGICVVVTAAAGMLLYRVPYTYVLIFGDDNARALYSAYRFAKGNVDANTFEKYLNEHRLAYTHDVTKGQYIVSSATHADALYVHHDGPQIRSVVFSPD